MTTLESLAIAVKGLLRPNEATDSLVIATKGLIIPAGGGSGPGSGQAVYIPTYRRRRR